MGTTAGWSSPMQPILTSAKNPVGTEPMSEDTFAFLGSITFIGSGISLVFWSGIADCIGRKLSLLLVAVPYILSWILTLLAQSTEVLLLARFLTGLGIAGTVLIVPIYILEIADNDLRGILSSFIGLTINAGVLIPFGLGHYLGYYKLALISLTVPVAFVLIFIWLPETPMFFLIKGKREKAGQTLLWYQGGDFVRTEQILTEYKCVKNKETGSTGISFKSLFATKERRKSMFLSVSVMIALQTTGIFPILNFTEKVFSMSGNSLTPSQSSLIIALIQLIASCFCSVLIERTGRKPLLVSALMTMSVSLSMLGAHMYFATGTAYKWVPVISLSIQVIAYSLGGGGVAFIIVAEICPSEIRCFACSLMHLLTAVLGFFSVTFFPAMLHLLKPYGCFLLYSLCCFSFSLLFYFQLPETKGKSEIEIMKTLNKEYSTLNEKRDVSQPLSKDVDLFNVKMQK